MSFVVPPKSHNKESPRQKETSVGLLLLLFFVRSFVGILPGVRATVQNSITNTPTRRHTQSGRQEGEREREENVNVNLCGITHAGMHSFACKGYKFSIKILVPNAIAAHI